MKKLITLVLLFNGLLFAQPIPNNDEVEFREDIIFDSNVYLGDGTGSDTAAVNGVLTGAVGDIVYAIDSTVIIFQKSWADTFIAFLIEGAFLYYQNDSTTGRAILAMLAPNSSFFNSEDDSANTNYIISIDDSSVGAIVSRDDFDFGLDVQNSPSDAYNVMAELFTLDNATGFDASHVRVKPYLFHLATHRKDNSHGVAVSGDTITLTLDADSVKIDIPSAAAGYVLTATDNDGQATWQPGGGGVWVIDSNFNMYVPNDSVLNNLTNGVGNIVVGLGGTASALTDGSTNIIISTSGATSLTAGGDNVLIGTSLAATLVTGSSNVILGSSNVSAAGTSNGVAIGSNNAAASNGVAIGSTNAAGNGICLGNNSSASSNSIVLGFSSNASNNGIVIGEGASASDFSIAIGTGATADGLDSVTVIGGSGCSDIFFGREPFGIDNPAFLKDIRIQSCGGSGTNTRGANLTVAGGKGTGNALGGSLIFQTSAAGASGTTLQSLVTHLEIDNEGNWIAPTLPSDSTGLPQFAIWLDGDILKRKP